jgi:nitric oxide reductase large subunit
LVSSLLFLAIIAIFTSNKKNAPIAYVVIGSIVGFCLFFAFLLYSNPTSSLGKLQWFKTTVWLSLFCSILISNIIPQKNTEGIIDFNQFWCVFVANINKSEKLPHSLFFVKQNQFKASTRVD